MQKPDKKSILLVEDDRNTRSGIARLLRQKYEITEAEDGARALNILRKNSFDLVISDIQMPGASGLDILTEIQKKDSPPLCVLITAYGTIETAVDAIKKGAYDFVSKPVDIDRLELIISRALESRELKEENRKLKRQLDEKYGLEKIVGNSVKMHDIFELVKQVAPARSTVLVTGESGTGKELIARSIHNLSGRKGAFVPVHCAALPSTLLESELFGYEKGAFTGAVERRAGRFEAADNGTIFLDEIGEIDQSVQVKLLRILESKSFERVGSSEPVFTDSRIIAATNKNLMQLVQDGKFREDLYYRLNVLTIELPPLRARKEDIPLLVKSFVDFYSAENGKDFTGVSEDVLKLFDNYDWPGNIRELRNCIERMVVLCRGNELHVSDVPLHIREKISPGLVNRIEKFDSLDMESNEKRLIAHALNETNGNRTLAAEKLGISRRTLHRKLNEYNLK